MWLVRMPSPQAATEVGPEAEGEGMIEEATVPAATPFESVEKEA